MHPKLRANPPGGYNYGKPHWGLVLQGPHGAPNYEKSQRLLDKESANWKFHLVLSLKAVLSAPVNTYFFTPARNDHSISKWGKLKKQQPTHILGFILSHFEDAGSEKKKPGLS